MTSDTSVTASLRDLFGLLNQRFFDGTLPDDVILRLGVDGATGANGQAATGATYLCPCCSRWVIGIHERLIAIGTQNQAAATLLHELVHIATGDEDGPGRHDGAFVLECNRIGELLGHAPVDADTCRYWPQPAPDILGLLLDKEQTR